MLDLEERTHVSLERWFYYVIEVSGVGEAGLVVTLRQSGGGQLREDAASACTFPTKYACLLKVASESSG